MHPRALLAITLLSALSLGAVRASAAPATVSGEFTVTVFADGLSYPTGLAFDGNGVLHATEANLLSGTGRVLRLVDSDDDGVADDVRELASGLGLATGLTFRGLGFPLLPAPPRSAGSARSAGTDLERIRRGQFRDRPLPLFVSHYRSGGEGQLSRFDDSDRDGIVDLRTDVVRGLPSDGLNGNQQPAVGPDGWIYFGQGARTNAGVPTAGPPDEARNGTILRTDGVRVEIFAHGMRNPFDLAFLPEGGLLATENGPDASGPAPVVAAPDELNAVVQGHDYGWPSYFGVPPIDTGTVSPATTFEPGTSTDGLALVTPASWCGFAKSLMAAQFGSFSDPTIGRRLILIRRLAAGATTTETFATGFGRPLDVAFGPDDALYVADFSGPFFTPSSGVIYRIAPRDDDGDGISNLCAR